MHAKPGTVPKNILLITADQWRGDCLGCVGHPLLKTPYLDGLAAEGLLFRRHYCQAVPCGPSRASLLTGMYLMNHRCVNNGTPLDRRFTNVALEARKAGYDPTLFGYTDTSYDPRDLHPNDPALKTYENTLPGMSAEILIDDSHKPWIAWLKSRGRGPGLSRETVFLPSEDARNSRTPRLNCPPRFYGKEESDTAFLTDSMLSWMRVREHDNWFVHLSYLRPHPPWVAPEPYNRMYNPDDVPPPVRAESIAAEIRQHPLISAVQEWKPRSGFFPGEGDTPVALASDEEVRQARATYFGLMTEVDHHLGRVFSYLKETGQYDSTMIVFTSDHGEQLGDHHLFGKLSYFDESYHIPLIIRDPRFTTANLKNRQIDRFTESVDLMPTILDWLDVEVPDQCDGVSLQPFIQGEMPERWRTEVHWEFDFRMIGSFQPMIEKRFGLLPDQCCLAAIRDEHFKYVHMTASPPLFFDLRADPHQFVNQAENTDYQEMLLTYAQKMLSWNMNHRERVLANMNVEFGQLLQWRGPRC